MSDVRGRIGKVGDIFRRPDSSKSSTLLLPCIGLGVCAIVMYLMLWHRLVVFDRTQEMMHDWSVPVPCGNTTANAPVVFFRILGNEIPFRHRPGQTLENLLFILKSEYCPPEVMKIFILNRIVNKTLEKEIEKVLDRFGRKYIRIPFVASEYKQVKLNLTCLHDPKILFSTKFHKKLDRLKQRRIYYNIYRDKSMYVMNNNGARNYALDLGKRMATWVMPWDGNCFVAKSAWKEILEAIHSENVHKYMITPMARALSADLNSTQIRGMEESANEEPQIIFHRDSEMKFDDKFYYAQLPKAELLQRLRVPGPWMSWSQNFIGIDCPRGAERGPKDNARLNVGWTVRLFSGYSNQEKSGKKGSNKRGLERMKGVLRFLFSIDAKHSDMQQEKLTVYNLLELQKQRKLFHQNNSSVLTARVKYLFYEADDILNRKQSFSTAARRLSMALDNNSSSMIAKVNNSFLTDKVQWSIHNIVRCSLASFFSGNEAYAHHATRELVAISQNLSLVYLTDSTPVLHYALDSARLLDENRFLSNTSISAIEGSMREHLKWMHDKYLDDLISDNIVLTGLQFDLHIASIADYLNDDGLLQEVLVRAYSRLPVHFENHWDYYYNLSNKKHVIGNLLTWAYVSKLALRWNIDFWAYPDLKKSFLGTLIRKVMDNVHDFSPGSELEALVCMTPRRFLPDDILLQAKYKDSSTRIPSNLESRKAPPYLWLGSPYITSR